MKVVLRQPVDGLGKRGIIDVSVGHARNYLIPHALAIPATAGIEAQAESMRRSRMLRDAKDREAAEEIAKHLVSKTISITARAGEGDRLFGSVSMSDIAAAINDQAGVDIDRRKLEIADAIKELGQYQVTGRSVPGNRRSRSRLTEPVECFWCDRTVCTEHLISEGQATKVGLPLVYVLTGRIRPAHRPAMLRRECAQPPVSGNSPTPFD